MCRKGSKSSERTKEAEEMKLTAAAGSELLEQTERENTKERKRKEKRKSAGCYTEGGKCRNMTDRRWK